MNPIKFSKLETKSTIASERLVFVITLLLVFIMAARSPLDSDLWWHLRAGEETWSSGKPLLEDSFSFSRSGKHWINHSWLSQVGMYLLFHWKGYLGLGSVMASLATISMMMLFFQMEGPALYKSFLIVLGSLVSAFIWSPRPQLVSLVLMSVVSYLLYLYKWKCRDYLLALPILFVLWSNLHGGYPLGLMLIGLMVGGEILNHTLGIKSKFTLKWERIRRLGILTIVSIFALLINPNGINTWWIPFHTVRVEALQELISEWASPDFHNLPQQSILWLFFGLFISVGFSKRMLDGTDLLMVVWFGYLAFLARRNYGPYVIVAVPVLSRHLWRVLKTWFNRLKTIVKINLKQIERMLSLGVPRISERNIRQKGLNLGIVFLLALIAYLKIYIVTHPVLMDAYLKVLYPVQAVTWLCEHDIQGRLFNEYNWGGYLIWFLRDSQVFIDGRTDLYGDDIIREWLDVTQLHVNWEDILEKAEVDLILLAPDRPITKVLTEYDWRLLYMDEQSALYGK